MTLRWGAVIAASVVLCAGTAPVRAETLLGAVYPSGSHAGEPLRWELQRETAVPVWRSWYRTASGEVRAEDELRWDGTGLASYRYVRVPIDEVASVTHEGGDLVYRQTLKGDHRERREPYRPDLLVGPMPIIYVQRHWDRLGAGERLLIRYAVLDQLRSFAFRLERDGSHPANRIGRAVVRMSPDSTWLRVFVGPAYFVYSGDGRTFHALSGRMLPVAVNDGRPRPIDGELIVTEVRP